MLCVIPKFSACSGEHCGVGPGLKECKAGQTQQETQWGALTTFNSRTGLCFSINSHIKQQELRATINFCFVVFQWQRMVKGDDFKLISLKIISLFSNDS